PLAVRAAGQAADGAAGDGGGRGRRDHGHRARGAAAGGGAVPPGIDPELRRRGRAAPDPQRRGELSRRGLSVLLTNGRIYTLDASDAVVDTLVIRDGRVVFAGRRADANVSDAEETIDLGGRAVVPGLVDAHGHLMHLARAGRAAGRAERHGPAPAPAR